MSKEYEFICPRCGVKHIKHLMPYEYRDCKGYCSYTCSNSRKHTNETKKKISKGLKKAYRDGRMKKRKRCNKRIIIEKLFGKKCFFCGFEGFTNYHNHIHRKDGKQHRGVPSMNLKELEEINPKEYVCLCGRCHGRVHWCMKYLNMTWEEIEKRYDRSIENREGIVEQHGSSLP